MKELRLAAIDGIEAGTGFLAAFIARFSERFAEAPAKPENLHRKVHLPTSRLTGIFRHREQRYLSIQPLSVLSSFRLCPPSSRCAFQSWLCFLCCCLFIGRVITDASEEQSAPMYEMGMDSTKTYTFRSPATKIVVFGTHDFGKALALLKNVKPILPRITALLRPDQSDIWIIVAYSIGIGLLTLALPVASQSLINTVAFGTVLQPIIVLSILLFAALIAASALQAFRHWLVEVLQRRLFVRIAGNSGHRLLHAQSSFFDNVHGPELVNRFLDAAIVQKSIAVILIDGLTITMQTTVGLLLLAVYHPLLLLFDAVLFVLILIILFGLGRGAVRSSIQESEAKYEMLAWLEELARNRGAFRSNPGRNYGWERTNSLAKHYIEKRTAHFRIEFRQMLGSLGLQAFALSALLGFGGYLVTQGQLTLGQLVAGELIVSTIVYGFTKLSKSLESYYDLTAAIDEIGYLDDLPIETELGHQELPTGSSASLELFNLEYAYRRGHNALSALNLRIEAGEKVAIHGTLGSGKSTLLDIVSSLRAPDGGHLEVDGCDYRDLKLDNLRTRIVLVRRPEIFAGTLLENLTLGADLESRRVRSVLEQVGLQSQVSMLPDALQTRLSTGGAPLTRTQSLRLMIARSLLLQPGVLLLDGVFDALEGLQSDDPLLDTLLGPNAPWTLVLTSDKVEVLRRCSRIYLLESGTLQPSPFSHSGTQESAS